jgi:hypothetical protein
MNARAFLLRIVLPLVLISPSTMLRAATQVLNIRFDHVLSTARFSLRIQEKRDLRLLSRRASKTPTS